MDVRTLEKERIAVRNRDAMITRAKEKPLVCLPIIVSLFGFILFITYCSWISIYQTNKYRLNKRLSTVCYLHDQCANLY